LDPGKTGGDPAGFLLWTMLDLVAIWASCTLQAKLAADKRQLPYVYANESFELDNPSRLLAVIRVHSRFLCRRLAAPQPSLKPYSGKV
jgi:hypothetical protein